MAGCWLSVCPSVRLSAWRIVAPLADPADMCSLHAHCALAALAAHKGVTNTFM